MGAKLEISHSECGGSPHLETRAIAIVPRRRGVYFNLGRELELGPAAQVLKQNFFFDFELMLVAGVLVVTSAAVGEILTLWLDALCRWLDNTLESCAREALLARRDHCFNFFARQHKGEEDSFGAALIVRRKAGESVAAVDEFFNG